MGQPSREVVEGAFWIGFAVGVAFTGLATLTLYAVAQW